MGSSEILQILRKNHNKKLTASEISEFAEVSVCAVRFTLKRLIKDVSEALECRPLTPEEKELRFGKKVGARIYLYWLDE